MTGHAPHAARKPVSLMALALCVLMEASSPAAPDAPANPLVPRDTYAAADTSVLSAVPSVLPATASPLSPPIPARSRMSPTVPVSQALVPFVELGELRSHPGEDLDGFLVRTAQVMDLFTRTTGHEVCGVILSAVTMPGWRVRLTTNRSHIACTMVEFPMRGFKRLGPDIHSHPRMVGGARANAQDILRKPEVECGQGLIVFDESFSARDLDRGPGYLVSRGRLLYQRGRQLPFQERARFEPIAALPDDFQAASATPTRGSKVAGSVAADAAWSNQDLPSPDPRFPTTKCPPPSQAQGTQAADAPARDVVLHQHLGS